MIILKYLTALVRISGMHDNSVIPDGTGKDIRDA